MGADPNDAYEPLEAIEPRPSSRSCQREEADEQLIQSL